MRTFQDYLSCCNPLSPGRGLHCQPLPAKTSFPPASHLPAGLQKSTFPSSVFSRPQLLKSPMWIMTKSTRIGSVSRNKILRPSKGNGKDILLYSCPSEGSKLWALFSVALVLRLFGCCLFGCLGFVQRPWWQMVTERSVPADSPTYKSAFSK